MARILVVDDDPDILRLTETVLGSAGHTIFVAEDALKALDWLNHIDFDLLLSDANMPHYSGFELVKTVKGDGKFKDLSIAMLTGLRERKDVERAVELGVDDYIVKPLDPMILVQKVNSLFQKRPPQQYHEVQLGGTGMALAHMRRPVTIETVSELGIRILSDMPIKAGMMIDLETNFFTNLEVQPPPMKVLSVEIDKPTGSYRAQLIFLGARESFLQKIRKWLYSHASQSTRLVQ